MITIKYFLSYILFITIDFAIKTFQVYSDLWNFVLI